MFGIFKTSKFKEKEFVLILDIMIYYCIIDIYVHKLYCQKQTIILLLT